MRNQYVKRIFFALLILTLSFSSFTPSSVQAAVTYDASLSQPTIPNTFSVAQEQTGDYVAPTNSFDDDSPKYIFVTQDSGKAGNTTVTYNSTTYPVTTLVSTGNDLSTLNDGSGSILRANMTLFFDIGTYTDPDGDNYFGFSKDNLSMIGLTPGTVTITRALRSTDGTMERTGFQNKNIYLENLIFDGRSKNMSTDSRGQFFFFMAGGSTGFVMKNCTIQNVGAANTAISNKNVAINFYVSSGQHNFENVTFKNIKTSLNYGIISFNDSKDNYFKNITVANDAASGSSTYSVKVEHTVTTNAINTISNVFSGSLSLPTDSNHNFVYIQDFNYGKTIFPSAFRYAQYKNSNGTNSTSAIQVYQTVLPTVAANRGILDLNDNSWLVQAANARSISNQLADILAVKTGMNSAGALAKWPTPNIKISANSSGEIGSFAIPSYTGNNVRIVAIQTLSDPFSSTTLVPFTAGGVITGNTNVTSQQFFNFDFHAKAKYTLQEVTAHRGLSYIALTDPNEGGSIPGYPVYSTYGYSVNDVSPIFPNVSSSNFGNSKFTSLANEIEITPPSSTILLIGDNLTLIASLKDSATNSYTGTGFTGTIKDSADDQAIQWFSSNPAIATVGKTTGIVAGVSAGAVTIFAKAVDANNQGEIEKPFASLNLTINSLPTDTPTLTPTATETPTETPTFTPTATDTPTETATFTPTVTNTPTDTATFTPTVTDTPTNTATFTPTFTDTPTNTATVTPTFTDTPTNTATFTPTATDTPTNTATFTPTFTETPTNTATFTPTDVPTNTATFTPTVTYTPTNTATFTPTVTDSPTITPTFTPTATFTFTPTASSTPKIESTQDPSSIVAAYSIPLTGFAPGRITLLRPQTKADAYSVLGDLWLEIPSQNVQMKIVGVPLSKGQWDISWLGNSAGYLEGSAYPTFNGNSVLTGHVYLSNGKPGPFKNIKNLKFADEIIVHAFGQKYTYQVQTIDYLRPQDVKKLMEHKANPWLTLLTCYQYNDSTDTYRLRVAVRAELVSVSAE